MEVTEDYLERLKAELPELAEEKMARYQREWSLPAYDTEMITGQKALADFFEETVALGAPPKQAANWIMGEVLRQRDGGKGHGLYPPDAGPPHCAGPDR